MSKKRPQPPLKKIIEGKTKIVRAILGTNDVLIQSKDDITAGDGVRKDQMANKGALATATTCNCFQLLNNQGIRTHFIEQVDEKTFRARRVHMSPVELVARRIATGSFLKRNPSIPEGTVFDSLVLEMFFKDDAAHDPLMIWNEGKRCFQLHSAKKPVELGYFKDLLPPPSFVPTSQEQVEEFQDILTRVFLILEGAWQKQGVTLVDLKIEGGYDAESKELLVADVIDNDSWRIWPAGDKAQMKDKQVYRNLGTVTPEAMAAIRDNYAWVAQATAQFLQ